MDSTTVAPPTPPRLSQRIVTLVGDARELLCDHLELAALEARRAGAGLVRTLCAAVVISLLVVTAWLALVAAGIVWVTDAGVGWGGALAFAALANLLLAAGVGVVAAQPGTRPAVRRDAAPPAADRRRHEGDTA